MLDGLVEEASDDFAKALGSVMLNFAYLEAVLSVSIWVLVDISDVEVGRIVTARRPFSQLVDVFDALYRHRVIRILQEGGMKAESQSKALSNLVKRMTEANEKRNQVVHSTWAGNVEKPEICARFKFTVKRSRGLKRVEERMAVNDVSAVAQFIKEVGDELSSLSEPSYSPIFWLSHWQTWVDKWEEWGESEDWEKWLE